MDKSLKPISSDKILKGSNKSILSLERKILGGKLSKKISNPIKEKNKQDFEEKCLICQDSAPDAAFQHCGHGGFCTNCAFEMVTIKPECHLCRSEIKQVVQLKYPNHYMHVYQAICITDIIIECVDDDNAMSENANVESQNNDTAGDYDFNM